MTMKQVLKAVGKRKPEILLATGIVAGVGAIVCAIKGTVEAVKKVDEEIDRRNAELLREAEENGYENCEQITKLPPKDVIKTTWKCYIPTAVTGGASMLCLIGSGRSAARRQAALTTALTMGETALEEFRQTVEETVDDKTMSEIKQKVAEKQVEKHRATECTDVYMTGHGSTLCLDAMTGRRFRSNLEAIRRAENNIKELLYHGFGQYASLNDFYDELNLEHVDAIVGDELGWNIDHPIRLDICTTLDAVYGEPCIVVKHATPPRYNYMNW